MILDCLAVVDQTEPFPSQRQSINHPPVISTLSIDSVKGVNEYPGGTKPWSPVPAATVVKRANHTTYQLVAKRLKNNIQCQFEARYHLNPFRCLPYYK